MKGLIELSKFPVWTVSLKCTIPSETESEGEVKVKMYGKAMEKMSNHIFQDEAKVGFKFDVHQSCRARRAVSFYWRPFSNSLNKF